MGIADSVPTPDNYGSFKDLSRKHQHRTFPVAVAQDISVV